MQIYDKELDAEFGFSPEQLHKSLEKLSLNYCEELAQAYNNKELRLSKTIGHISQLVADLDIHNATSPIRNDATLIGTELLKMEGWIEYITIMCMGLSDIFALFISHAFSLKCKTRNVSFAKISQYFKNAVHKKELLGQIQAKMEDLQNKGDYKYISDMNNYVKHNNVLCACLKFGFKPAYFEVRINGFTHNDTSYPEITLHEFIAKIRTVQNNLTNLYMTFLEHK